MRVKFLLPFTFFIISTAIFAQDPGRIERINTDSLLKVLSDLEGTEKIDVLNKIATGIFKEYPDSSRNYAARAMSLSDSLEYQKGIADGYLNMGNYFLMMDSLYPTMVNYLNALRIYEHLGPSPEYASVCKRLSDLNIFAGRYLATIDYDYKAIEIYKELNESEELGFHYHSICNSLYSMGKYDSALIYNEMAMSYTDSLLLFRCYNDRALIYSLRYSESGDTVLLNKAITWFEKGLNSPGASIHFKAAFNANLHYCYSQYGEEKKDSIALSYLTKVIPTARESKDALYLIPIAYRYYGNHKSYQKDYDSAIIYFNKAIDVIDEELKDFSIGEYSDPMHALQNRYYMKRDLKYTQYNLYATYQYLGDQVKASEHSIQHSKLLNEEKARQNENLIAMLEAESENEKTNNQIALLERDKDLSELRAFQLRNLIIGIGGLFLLLLVIGFLFVRQNKLRNEHKNTLLEQKLLRLQMNPHFIFNALSNIHSLMNPKDVDKASDYLGRFSRLLRTSLESSREDHILLEDEISSIKNYLELQSLRYDHKFDYSIEVDPEINLENAIIPPMLIQPFIENSIEHGMCNKKEKGHIQIRFKLDQKKLSCDIEDDGIGREKAWETEYSHKGEHKSLATEIIRDRIGILNRKFRQKISLNIIDLKSDADQALGTLVRLDLPYLLD